MKDKILSAIVFGATALALVRFFEDIDGMEPGPITGYFGLVQTAIAGAVLFVVACVVSLLSSRFGVSCAFLASIISWPYFGPALVTVPWSRVISLIMGSPLWRNEFTALLMLIISTTYSAVKLRALLRVLPTTIVKS